MASSGATVTVNPPQMGSPLTILALNYGCDKWRSVTVTNVTTATNALVNFSPSLGGSPQVTIGPGQITTVPFAPTNGITITFVPIVGAIDGYMTIHADETPLTASGYNSTPFVQANTLFDFSPSGAFSLYPTFNPPFTTGNAFTGGFFVGYAPPVGKPDSFKNRRVYLTDLIVTGNDIDRVRFQITLANSSYSVGYQFRGNLTLSVPQGYYLGSNDANGSYGIVLIAQEAYTPPLNIFVAACAGFLQ